MGYGDPSERWRYPNDKVCHSICSHSIKDFSIELERKDPRDNRRILGSLEVNFNVGHCHDDFDLIVKMAIENANGCFLLIQC